MDIKKLIEKVLKYDNDGEIIIELIEQKIVSVKDVITYGVNSNKLELIFLLAKYASKEDIRLLEDKIIEIGIPEYICRFASIIQGADINKLENKIIEISNARYIFEFADYVVGANIERLEDKIIEIGNCHYIYLFATHIENANIERLGNKILELGDSQYIFLFSLFVNKLEYNDVEYIEKLGWKIAEIGDSYYICRFAIRLGNNVSNELMNNFLGVLIKTGDIKFIEEFCLNVPNISFDKYTEAISIVKKNKNKKVLKKIKDKFLI